MTPPAPTSRELESNEPGLGRDGAAMADQDRPETAQSDNQENNVPPADQQDASLDENALQEPSGAAQPDLGETFDNKGDDIVEKDEPKEDALDGKPNEREDLIAGDEPVRHEGMDWFVLRVASNKESSVRETLLRKVQIEGMDHLVSRILVPMEKTKTIKGGKQRITQTKLYPGYVFVEMRLEDDGRIPQDVFFLIKETTGVGDFVGTAGRPTPLQQHEIEKMLQDSKKPEDEPTVKLTFEKGEAVTIKEGPFEGYEGTVDELLPEKGLVRVLVTIFGRQAPVELEEWQIIKTEDA